MCRRHYLSKEQQERKRQRARLNHKEETKNIAKESNLGLEKATRLREAVDREEERILVKKAAALREADEGEEKKTYRRTP